MSESISVSVALGVELRMVPPCRGSIRVLNLRAPRVILQAIVPLSLVEFLGQSLDTGYLFRSLLLDLFDGFLRQLTTM
jgi:hypothetical protein